MNTGYPSSQASFFASKARSVPAHICTWCMESGQGRLVFVNGRLVLDSHQECMTSAAGNQGGQCCCFEKAGDNDKCPVHGKG